MRVVFDTNVLVSALAWGGPPRRCLELARHDLVEGWTCWELLDEYSDVLIRKLGLSEELALQAVIDLLGFLRVARILGRVTGVTRDPADDKVVECALEAKATVIATGDKDLLVLGSFQDVRILTPAALVHDLASPSLPP